MKNESQVTSAKWVARVEEALTRHENYKRCDLSISWIANRIDWLWTFRYISEEKMHELCDRVTALNERELI